MPSPDETTDLYETPETLAVGLARRAGQHAFAADVVAALEALGANVVDWTIALTGRVDLRVRQGGGGIRDYQFVATPAQQAAVKAAVLSRFVEFEAHYG